MKKLLVLFTCLFFGTVASAADQNQSDGDMTAAGMWQTYKGGKPGGAPDGKVQIYEENGVWYGKIAGSSNPDDKDNVSYCTNCSGEFKDKPVQGLRFMWGFTRDGNKYTGGNILDPNTGSTYNSSMTLVDNGQVLKMRGYMGISLFGQTETWTRIKEPAKVETAKEKVEQKTDDVVKKIEEKL